MYNVSAYWIGKKERAKIAEKHTKKMEMNYHSEIADSISRTKTYTEKVDVRDTERTKPEIILLNTDSVDAIFRKGYGRMAVLNFASYKNPGGAFLRGSSAQEESLCHESFLYSVLKKNPEYYQYNNTNKNKGLYTDRALYSPGIRFFHNDETVMCDVITCAAPNKAAAQKYCDVTDEENLAILKKRLRFVKDIAERNKVEVLILGAWGAGVFGQNAREVAEAMRDMFANTSIRRVVYAVPGNDDNYNAFKSTFAEYLEF